MYADPADRREIVERWLPYAFDTCQWCGEPEDEPHDSTCLWVEIRSEYHLPLEEAA